MSGLISGNEVSLQSSNAHKVPPQKSQQHDKMFYEGKALFSRLEVNAIQEF